MRLPTLLTVLLSATLSSVALIHAAQDRTMPTVNVTDLKGAAVSSSSLLAADGLTIISFWATWCKPCMLELDNIGEVYADWQKEQGVKVVAVSIDDARSIAKIPALVNGRGWPFTVVVDRNGELKRGLGVNNVPHVFVVAPNGTVVFSRLSYTAGDEKSLYEVIKKETARLKLHQQPAAGK